MEWNQNEYSWRLNSNFWFPLWKAQEENIIWDYTAAGDAYPVKYTYQLPSVQSAKYTSMNI